MARLCVGEIMLPLFNLDQLAQIIIDNSLMDHFNLFTNPHSANGSIYPRDFINLYFRQLDELLKCLRSQIGLADSRCPFHWSTHQES